VIVLDTHIWVWWVHGDSQLTSDQREALVKRIQQVSSCGLQRIFGAEVDQGR